MHSKVVILFHLRKLIVHLTLKKSNLKKKLKSSFFYKHKKDHRILKIINIVELEIINSLLGAFVQHVIVNNLYDDGHKHIIL